MTKAWTLSQRLSINMKHELHSSRTNLCGGWYLRYKHGRAWQIWYNTLPPIHQGHGHVLTVVEAARGWPDTHSVSQANTRMLSQALKSKAYGDTILQKKSKTMRLISERTFKTTRLKNMAWSSFITSPVMHQPPGKSTGLLKRKHSNGWWGLQILGATDYCCEMCWASIKRR